MGWWQEGHPAVKTLATKHDLRRSLRVSLSVGSMCAVVLSIIVECVNNGGGRCSVHRVSPVGDDAWREFCRSDRPTRASMEKRKLNSMID